MTGTLDRGLARGALARFDCECIAYLTEYDPCIRRAHEIGMVSHTACGASHRCGASGTDGQHRGCCGPKPLDIKPAVKQAPAAPVAPTAPVLPRPLQRKPAVKQAALPLDSPPDFGDSAWDSLLEAPMPAGRR